MGRAGCRVVLNPALAAEIYTQKAIVISQCNVVTCRRTLKINRQSIQLGKLYNVSPKTIRDIWNCKTWTFATHHLWSLTDRCQAHSQVLDAGPICNAASPLNTHSNKPSTRTHERHSSDKQAFHFVSVLEDSEFLASSSKTVILCHQPQPVLPSFQATADPFHNDWPHW
jgi:hypothetical protein